MASRMYRLLTGGDATDQELNDLIDRAATDYRALSWWEWLVLLNYNPEWEVIMDPWVMAWLNQMIIDGTVPKDPGVTDPMLELSLGGGFD